MGGFFLCEISEVSFLVEIILEGKMMIILLHPGKKICSFRSVSSLAEQVLAVAFWG